MTDVWCPGARRVDVGPGSGRMLGGEARCTHHTTEGSSIDGAVATYRKTRCYPTFTVDYLKDDVVQHLPVNVGGTALENDSGGVQTNRQGTVNIQVEWIGRAADPFTAKRAKAGPKVRALFDFIRSHGVPDVWPAGPPQPYPDSYGKNGDRLASDWLKAGHFGHSQTPENAHGDPGAIDPDFIKQTAMVRPPTTTSSTTSTEDGMFIIEARGRTTRLVEDGKLCVKLKLAQTISAYKGTGIRVQVMDPDVFSEFVNLRGDA